MDTCILCGNPYKHRRLCTGYVNDDKTLKEVTFILAHAGCRNLMKRKKDLQQQLLEVEYEIFMKVNG